MWTCPQVVAIASTMAVFAAGGGTGCAATEAPGHHALHSGHSTAATATATATEAASGPATASSQAAGSPAVAAVVDDCAEEHYVDRSADSASRVLTWDYSFPATPERCIRIRVGQTVRWNGNFPDHPLDPDQGDAPNPIAQHDGSGVVTFSQPGTFGFRCNYHFEMRGAIRVVASPVPAAVPGTGRTGAVALTALLLLSGTLAARWRRSLRLSSVP